MLISLLLSGLAVLISAYVIPGVTVDGFFAAIVAAVMLSLVNALIRPVLGFLTLPITVVTLGLFSFVLSGLMVLLTAAIVPGFDVVGFWAAFWFAIVLSLVNGLLGAFKSEEA